MKKREHLHYNGRCLYWTGEMLSLLRKHFPDTDTREVAELIGVSVFSVKKKAKELGLKKSRSYIYRIRDCAGRLGRLFRKIKKKKNTEK